ncbi:MAG: hypothetical protein FRX48_05973 [Lasallia pustulata]|uniref:Fido domain-containing protein n=1 Tax=Lasallia pustulata TaxID=136370 RepID=A0A5M8PM31_9LECA|nr:MAG: hypothetical protein FRX48_05973 [Lasallia pustulata]
MPHQGVKSDTARPRLSDVFEDLDICSDSVTSPMNLAKINLLKSIRGSVGHFWPHWGSIRDRPKRATFTVKMDDLYRYPLDEILQQPDDAFNISQQCFADIQKILAKPTTAQRDSYEAYLKESFMNFIFGSNLIERVGLGYDQTVRICERVLAGEDVPAEIEPRTSEYQAAISDMAAQNKQQDRKGVIRSRAEIIQHTQALKYIMSKLIIDNETLTEAIILQTHSILCDGIPLEDGSGDLYAGMYRQVSVVAGFSSFTPAHAVPFEMRKLVRDFNADVLKAEAEGSLDPYMLATKYCHKFVNIHPFVDGNGRTCRLILNAILLKYAGIIVALGEREDRDEYLQIAIAGNMAEQQEEDEYSPPWAELATHVLTKAAVKLEGLREALYP